MRYNFLTRTFQVDKNMSPNHNMAALAAIQASTEIAPSPLTDDSIIGTRSSGTLFTRTGGTWTAHALMGQFLWSFATGTPSVGEFLKITDNTTGAVTIDATYGSGALQTTGTSILILADTSETEAMKLLEEMSTWMKIS